MGIQISAFSDRAAKRLAARPVGYVERCLKDERNAEIGGEFYEVLGDGDRERVRFKDARPGDEEEAIRFRRERRLIFFHGKH